MACHPEAVVPSRSCDGEVVDCVTHLVAVRKHAPAAARWQGPGSGGPGHGRRHGGAINGEPGSRVTVVGVARAPHPSPVSRTRGRKRRRPVMKSGAEWGTSGVRVGCEWGAVPTHRHRTPELVTAGSSSPRRRVGHLLSRVAGPLGDAHDCLLALATGQAEHLACGRIEPRPLETDSLFDLDLEVPAVRPGQLVAGDADEPVAHVHVPRYPTLLCWKRFSTAVAGVVIRPASCPARPRGDTPSRACGSR